MMDKQILTVTPNTTLDLTVFIPSFELNKTIRARDTVQSMGGKPTDASWILGELGIPSRALGLAAGATGRKVEAMLMARGVTVDFDWVDGETRTNVVIVCDDGSGQTTITTTTMTIAPEQVEALYQHYLRELPRTSVVVTGGTLPRGMEPAFYERCIRAAHEHGVPILFDAAEPNLSVGLAARPTYIKPNKDELEGLTGAQIASLADAYHAGRQIIERYGTQPVITLGGEGALAVLTDRAYFIPPLTIEVVSASGAGDAVLAGMAAAVHHGWPMEDGLRMGAAAAAAVCLMPGTADLRRADYERLLPQVRLEPFSP
ncbi:MAG: 1-phosphofructokinase family hexose kinase [Candidatus Flexifilum sp.]|jgi:1-phosphofructokinase